MKAMKQGALLLGIDTCGPSGSVALGRMSGGAVEILGQQALEGRTYSATLAGAVRAVLVQAGARLSGVHALVAVSGPGSFTGVRVGLSTVKGLAEAVALPVTAVSRLAVLAAKAGVDASALDAHRHEIFLRLGDPRHTQELLAGRAELETIDPAPHRVAVCDDGAAALLAAAWPGAELVHAAAPTAADALHLAAPLVAAGAFVDVAQLDGHYLRRSDAEIFGEPGAAPGKR